MKNAFIIGASSGIGKETARLFLRDGYKVYALSRSPCDLAGAIEIVCDVTDRQKLDDALRLVQQEERLDVFVYAAGFSMACPLEYVAEGDYRYLYEVNFFAYVHCLQTLLPVLKKAEGVACVVGSLGAILPIPFDAYYTSSKAALNAFSEALTYELESENVKILCVMPGGTKTGFSDKRKIYPPASVDGYAKMQSLACDSLRSREQSGASPEKVAAKIRFLCSYPPACPVVAVPFTSKLFRLCQKLLPARALRALLKASYFTEEVE